MVLRRRTPPIFLSLVVASGPACVSAWAQPAEPPLDVDPGVPFDEARRAHRAAPVADDVSVAISAPGEPTRTERLTIRIDAAGSEEGIRRILLELGPLRVYVGEERLVATRAGDPALYFETPFAAPITVGTLAEVLPPLPVPHLALLDPGDQSFRTPTPYTKGVTWTGAQLDAGAAPPVFRLSGHGFDGSVTMTTAAETGRVLAFGARFPGPSGESQIEITCRAADPGDPAAWAPNLEGRTRVGSLAELRAGSTLPPLRAGDPAPDFTLMSLDMSAWSLYRACRAGHPVVLLLFRVPPETARADAILADATAGLAAIRALRSAGSALQLHDRAAAVIDLPSFDRERFVALRGRWRGDQQASDELLWASSSAATIDRLSRTAGALVAVIRPDRTLVLTLPLDGRADDAAGVADALRGALTTDGRR